MELRSENAHYSDVPCALEVRQCHIITINTCSDSFTAKRLVAVGKIMDPLDESRKTGMV